MAGDNYSHVCDDDCSNDVETMFVLLFFYAIATVFQLCLGGDMIMR